VGREPGEKLVCGGALPIQDEAEKMAYQHAGSQLPVLGRLRLADRFDRVAVFRVPTAMVRRDV
jgi:hypothetical protein